MTLVRWRASDGGEVLKRALACAEEGWAEVSLDDELARLGFEQPHLVGAKSSVVKKLV